MTDIYTKAVLTVIAVSLLALVFRPIFGPPRVEAQGPSSPRLDRIEHNLDVMRSAANTNAQHVNQRFAKSGWGLAVVLVDQDAGGTMTAKDEPAIADSQAPNPL